MIGSPLEAEILTDQRYEGSVHRTDHIARAALESTSRFMFQDRTAPQTGTAIAITLRPSPLAINRIWNRRSR